MSDDRTPEIDNEDLELPDLDLGDESLVLTETGDGPLEGSGEAAAGGSFGRRLVGLLATALGVLGCLIALYLAFTSLRVLFGASDRADNAMAPVITAFDRMEERIDQTDDLVDRQGIDAAELPELRARVDGLVDVATSADRSFDDIDDRALYNLLPADLDPLGDALDRFRTSAELVDETLGTSTTVRAEAAATMADEVDDMQSSVSGARDRIDEATGSLRSWLRIGGLLGFLASLWGLWSQLALARRGWRGVRNRPI